MKNTLLTSAFLVSSLFLSAQISQFVWAKGASGTSTTRTVAIGVDASGNVYTTGNYSGTCDFDPSENVFNLTSTSEGSLEVFILKLDALGNFEWAKSIGAESDDYAYSIAVDSTGNVFTAGSFNLTVDFNPGAGVASLTAAARDAFILKLDTDGNFIWVKQFGGASLDDPYFMSLDKVGNIYATGSFFGTADFDPSASSYNLISNGDLDIFVLKLNADGNFVWAKNYGGAAGDVGYAVATDSLGNVFVTGLFQSDIDFNPGTLTNNFVPYGFSDIFICKIDISGNLLWSKQLGGNYIDYSFSLALDNQSNVFTTGVFYGTSDFDPGIDSVNLTSPVAGASTFISKLDASGNYVWATKIGTAFGSYTEGYSIGVDKLNNVYMCGNFSDTADFDPGINTYNLSSSGYNDAFVVRLSNTGEFIEAMKFGGSLSDRAFGVKLDDALNIYCTGDFGGTADFDPGAGVFNLISDGGIYVVKLVPSSSGLLENSANEIEIIPNPSNGIFSFNMKQSSSSQMMEVYTNLGELLLRQKIDFGYNKIDLSKQANGLYFLKLVQDGKLVESLKIIKQ